MERAAAVVSIPAPVATRIEHAPVTRVGGAMALSVKARSGGFSESRCSARMFRGYEAVVLGRDVRDAVYLASRCCGYHGGQHSIAAAQAVEMAMGLTPPPTGIAIRNLGLAAETIHAEAAHLVLLAGPDLCEQSVRRNWPALWAAAEQADSPHAEIHGLGTIGEIMYALNPWSGRWYLEALKVARVPYAMYAILQGKYPHPQALVPGGVATRVSTTNVHDYLIRLLSLVDPAKQVATMIVDLLDFMLASVPELARVGASPANLIDSGQFDDPDGYDPGWEGLTERGERRWAAPGVILEGKLVTSDLKLVAGGVEESVANSFYEGWAGSPGPFDKRTLARPGPVSWDGPYSWSTSARWNGNVVETGPGARLWLTALRGRIPDNPFITLNDGAIQLDLPESALPRVLLEWRPPAAWNAFERNRARLYSIVFNALVAANQVFKILDLQKRGRHQTAVHFTAPRGSATRQGAGFAGDGLLGHWLQLRGSRIENYQVVSPSTFNIGPGGPAEAAIDASPALAATAVGAEALVALRSFDPCANCATH